MENPFGINRPQLAAGETFHGIVAMDKKTKASLAIAARVHSSCNRIANPAQWAIKQSVSSSYIGTRRLFRAQGPLLALIGVMFLIFFAQEAFGPVWYDDWMAVPTLLADNWQHLRDGEFAAVDWQQFATLLSCAFLHGSIEHVGFNMLYLWVFGALLVELIGWRWMAGVFVITAVAATATHAALNRGDFTPMLGASGAVMGFEGAYLGLATRWKLPNPHVWPMARPIPPEQLALLAVIGVSIDYFSILSKMESNTAYGAHVGGFTMGLLLGALLLPRPRVAGGVVGRK